MALPRYKLVETLENSEGTADALALLKSLANMDRLTILCSLIEAEKSVSELENTLGIRQPTLSQQLARLRGDELVSTRRDGKVIYYSIGSDEVEQVIEVLHDLYCS
ncbi:MAG: DNA-binding transcriptional ArsR family regulator [Gammaproteobacteria bacterium]|jgi:DNA-binding transcriptional ArsR family regulator